jgi:hypothetical protein
MTSVITVYIFWLLKDSIYQKNYRTDFKIGTYRNKSRNQ